MPEQDKPDKKDTDISQDSATKPKAYVEETKPGTVHRSPVNTSRVKLTPSQKIVIFALLAGLIGGAIGSYGFIRYFASSVPVEKRQIMVQENSAVIDVAKKVSPSVVSITTKTLSRGYFGSLRQQEGAGTGIIVSADGLIITNKHVVPEGTTTVTVVLADGKQYTGAKVIARDPLNDIAFVKVDATGLPVAKLGDSSQVVVGQRVVAIGNALGQFQNTVTEGIISGIGRPITAGESASESEDLQNLLQTDAAINPGNSGGPLVNLSGEVIGINTAVAGQGAQNIGFSIPINEAKPLIANVKSSGKIQRPYIGVRYVLLTPEIAAANDLKTVNGAWLVGDASTPALVAGGPAEKAGVKEGDIVIKIDGKTVDATHSPQSLIAGKKVGDIVTLTVVRDGKTQTIKVTLQEASNITE